MVAVFRIGLAVVAALLSTGTPWFGPAVINAVAALWSNGIAAYFSREEADEMPNWATYLLALSVLFTVVFLVLGLLLVPFGPP